MAYDYHTDLATQAPPGLQRAGLDAHLNVVNMGDPAEDAHLSNLMVAAWEHCENFLNRSVFPNESMMADVQDRYDNPGDYTPDEQLSPDAVPRFPMVANRAFCQAVLLVLGEWYSNREDSAEQRLSPIPNASKAILWPHRRGLGV